MNDTFTLGNLTVEKGKKIQGYLNLPFTEEDKLPCTLIYGDREGPTVLVDGGIHNAEYVGIECVTGLGRMLEPSDIKGILIMLHLVNVNGFKARTVSVSAEDGKNLNRCFPGDPNGTYTDKLAYYMEKELFSRIDYYIDVHNGDWFEDLSPFIYCVGNGSQETTDASVRMAMAADVPYYVISRSKQGGAYNRAGILGIPSVLLERGCYGLWSQEEVVASQKDVRNILREIGAFESSRFLNDWQKQVPRHMPHAHYIDSKHSGCWFPQKRAGQVVSPGELIGVMKDNFGNIIEEVRLDEACIILYQTVSYSVPKDSPLVAYGHYGECSGDQEGDVHTHSHEEDLEELHESRGVQTVLSVNNMVRRF